MVTRKEKKLSPFFYLSLVLLPLLVLPKGTSELFINRMHTPFWDTFFTLASAVGNGVSVALCGILVIIFLKKKWIYKFLIGTGLHFIFVHVFKQWLFRHAPRPIGFFDAVIVSHLNLVEGVRVHHMGTFPSGHTTSIFFLMSFIVLCLGNKKLAPLFVVTGLLVGMSRVYLMQHFFTDVYFGMVFGVLSTLMAHRIVKRIYKTTFETRLFPNAYSTLRRQLHFLGIF